MADEIDNQITEDDWAAAMQEQAASEDTGMDNEAAQVAADLAAAALGDSPYQAKPASQIFEEVCPCVVVRIGGVDRIG